MLISIAAKGWSYYIFALIAISILLSVCVFMLLLTLNGYAGYGTYGALVLPSLVLGALGVWQIRAVIYGLFNNCPLIFTAEQKINYTSAGYSAVSIEQLTYFLIDENFPRMLYLFDSDGRGIKHYPLFLSSTASKDVRRNLLRLGLRALPRAS